MSHRVSLGANIQRNGSIAVVGLTGCIELSEGSDTLTDVVNQLVEDGARQILLHMGGVSFIDSAGVGALVTSIGKVKRAGGVLGLACPQKPVEDALAVTRLTDSLIIFPSVEEGLGSFAPPPDPLIRMGREPAPELP